MRSWKKLTLKEKGNKLDISLGLVYDALESNFDNGEVIKGGIWATYEWSEDNLRDKGIAMIFLVRYLYNPNLSFIDENATVVEEDVTNFDLGGRLYYQKKDDPLSVSLEWIYRDYSTNSLENGTRYSLNIAYDIGVNNQLSLALGKNYDGIVTRKGDVIAALNLLIGLAASKQAY